MDGELGSLPIGVFDSGVGGLTVALAGWFEEKLGAGMRLLFTAASLLVLAPMPVAADALNFGVRGAGIAALIALYVHAKRGGQRAGATRG